MTKFTGDREALVSFGSVAIAANIVDAGMVGSEAFVAFISCRGFRTFVCCASWKKPGHLIVAAIGSDEWLLIVKLMDFLDVIGGGGRSLSNFRVLASMVGDGAGSASLELPPAAEDGVWTGSGSSTASVESAEHPATPRMPTTTNGVANHKRRPD